MKLLSFLSLSSIWGKVWPVLIAILFFGLIIFIHELGHFIFAKLFKVKVNEFALGMGPTLIKRKKKDTTYALRLFPIGGFVAMEGEDEDSELDEDRSKILECGLTDEVEEKLLKEVHLAPVCIAVVIMFFYFLIF